MATSEIVEDFICPGSVCPVLLPVRGALFGLMILTNGFALTTLVENLQKINASIGFLAGLTNIMILFTFGRV